MKLKRWPAMLMACGCLSQTANALEVDSSGYATFVASKVDNEQNSTYFHDVANTRHVDFDTSESHIGIQFDATVSEKVDVILVLQAEGGSNSGYDIETEWAYANYNFNDDLALRIGKVKGSFYMVSDYRNVGYAYPWIRPPLEVYSTNPITSFSGLDLVFQKTVNDVNYLLQFYTGSGHNKKGRAIPAAVDNPPTGYTITDKDAFVSFKTHGMAGINASIGTDKVTFRVGALTTKVDAFGQTDLDGSFVGAGLTVDASNFVFYSEYIQRDTDANLIAAFPDQNAWYATVGYRIGSVLPYVTYADIDKGKDDSPFAIVQSSVALGLRVEVADAASLKFEAMQVDPEDSGGFGRYGLYNDPLSGTEKGQVYSASFDIIF